MPHPVSLNTTLILFSNISLFPWSGGYSSSFPFLIQVYFLSLSMHTTCPHHLIRLKFFCLILHNEKYKLCSTPSCLPHRFADSVFLQSLCYDSTLFFESRYKSCRLTWIRNWDLCIIIIIIIRVVKSRRMRRTGHVARTWGRGGVYTGFWWGNLRQRDHLVDPAVDGMIILR